VEFLMHADGPLPTSTDVLISGGGPAGALLASLLARQGVDVLVLEKQQTIERTFRGETISAQSVRSLFELGYGPGLVRHGFLEQTGIEMIEDGRRTFGIDYRRFGTPYLPIDIPQPAVIDVLLQDAADHAGFRLATGANVTGLLADANGPVTGATVKRRGEEPVPVRARLVVGADGRFSAVRKASGLPVVETPMPRDFLWFRLPRPDDWTSDGQLIVSGDRNLVVLPTYPDLLRVGYNLPKGGLGAAREAGIDAFVAGVIALDPRLRELVTTHVRSFDDTSFLKIFTATLERWTRDGLLLIGDAAHTTSPILGQGVNLALQDAIGAAATVGTYLGAVRGTDPIPEAALRDLVSRRQRHKRRVTAMQTAQEASLAASGTVATAVRRLRMRAIDHLPGKYRLLGGVLNPSTGDDETRLMADRRLTEAKAFVGLHARHMGLASKELDDALERITMFDGTGRATWVGELGALADRDGQAVRERADLLNLARFPYADSPARAEVAARAATLVADDLAARDAGSRRIARTAAGPVPFLFRPAAREGAPLVVVVGGIVSLKEQWAPFLGLGPRLGCGVAVVDFPGVGEHPGRYDRSSADLFSAVMAAVPECDTDRTLLLAPSFGGHLALMAAGDDRRIARIVTVDAPLADLFEGPRVVERLPLITAEALRRACGVEAADLPAALAALALRPDDLSGVTARVDAVVSDHDEIVPGSDWRTHGAILPEARVVRFDDVHGAPRHLRHVRLITLKAILELTGRDGRASIVGGIGAVAGRASRVRPPAPAFVGGKAAA
jgi:2-polyprenyl-6-methoxyphenol hydroxylase-like FAD-dependent oxidoreductase